MGDPWKVSRSRERKRREEDEEPKLSLAELAYDKTAAIVGTVKDLLVNGYTKIKSFVASAREKSRTSRSRGRRGQSLSEDDSSSLDRYKTPMGRSKSRRGFSKGKVVPLDGPEM